MKRQRRDLERYTLDDLDCKLCSHFRGYEDDCELDTCCCIEELRTAVAHDASKNSAVENTCDTQGKPKQ